MARRHDTLLDQSYRLDPAGDAAKPLFEGCAVALSTASGLPSSGAGTPEFFSVVRPDDAAAGDGGYYYAGILDNGGFSGTPLFNLSPGSTNFPLPVDQSCKVQCLGFAKAKGYPAVTFVNGDRVGFLPQHGGFLVPLRLYPQAMPLGTCRSTLTAAVTTGSFITVELQAAPGFHGEMRGLARILGDSPAATGSAEVAFGTDGAADPTADAFQARIYANRLKVGSVVEVEAQVRMTGLNGTDTVQAQLRYGGAAGGLLASTGTTVAFAVGNLAILRSVFQVKSATLARLSHSSGIIGPPLAAATQVSGGAVAGDVTLPAITADRNIVATVKFSSANAGNTAVLESLIVRGIR